MAADGSITRSETIHLVQPPSAANAISRYMAPAGPGGLLVPMGVPPTVATSSGSFNSGVDIASISGVGVNLVVTPFVGRSAFDPTVSEAQLTAYTGSKTIPPGTYDRMKFDIDLTTASGGPGFVVNDGVTITRSLFLLRGNDTVQAGISMNGTGAGAPAYIGYCDMRPKVAGSSTVSPSCDRAIGVNGNGGWTIEYNYCSGTARGIYIGTHGIDTALVTAAGQDYIGNRILQWNILGNNVSPDTGQHTSSFGHGNGARGYYVIVRGNCFINVSAADSSGCFQWYPEAPNGDNPPQLGYQSRFWLIEKNYFAGTNGVACCTWAQGTGDSAHSDSIIRDNYWGVLFDGTHCTNIFVFGNPDQPVADNGVFATGNTHNNQASNNRWWCPALTSPPSGNRIAQHLVAFGV